VSDPGQLLAFKLPSGLPQWSASPTLLAAGPGMRPQDAAHLLKRRGVV
jgi:hypothetical protein